METKGKPLERSVTIRLKEEAYQKLVKYGMENDRTVAQTVRHLMNVGLKKEAEESVRSK